MITIRLFAVLVERFGSNLRNEEAHGLMNYEEFFAPQISYVWWLALRLCCTVLIAVTPQVEEDQQQERENE